MPSSSPDSSQELQYPPARIDQSFAGLDLNTLIMRSNAQVTHEVNPLEESTYEVIPPSDSLYDTSDDEGHTASVASTPDDRSSFDDDEDDNDDDFEPEYTDEHPLEVDAAVTVEPQDDYTLAGGHDSTLTEIPSMDGSENSCVIQLQEVPGKEHTTVDAQAVIKEFRKNQVSDAVLSRYECSSLRLSLRATLSERHLIVPVGRPFNVLYIGKMDEPWVQTEIDARVAAALNKSPGPSRSIMIRGQMETCGPDMLPWNCSDMELLEEAGKKTGVSVTLLHDQSKLIIPAENVHRNSDTSRIPDLVVFWYPHPNTPAPMVEDYHVASEVFGRQHVPCLHIAADRLFHCHRKGFTDDSLRVCVEGRNDDESGFEHQETIPIDLFTFMNLDSAQLNRHLAALSPPVVASGSSSSTTTTRSGLLRTPAMILKKHFHDCISPISLDNIKLLATCISLILVVALCMELRTVWSPPFTMPLDNSGRSFATPGSEPVHYIMTPPTPHQAMSLPSPAPIKSISWDLSVVSTPQQPSQRKKEPKAREKAAGFEIESTGEHQFVLTPSSHLTSRKRKPQLQIQVYQNAKSVPIQYVRTIEGTYVVDLEQRYPAGLFNVSIATHSKPLMQQSFSITMGSKKSRLARLVDDVKNDIAIAGQGIRELTSYWSERLMSELAAVEDNTEVWKDKVDHSKREVADHLQGAKKEVKRRFAAGAEVMNNLPGATWSHLRKATAPVRTSRASLQARKNALRIRCTFEQAVGLSSQRDDDKKTHACKSIGR